MYGATPTKEELTMKWSRAHGTRGGWLLVLVLTAILLLGQGLLATSGEWTSELASGASVQVQSPAIE